MKYSKEVCRCGKEFIVTEFELAYMESRQWSKPRSCLDCRYHLPSKTIRSFLFSKCKTCFYCGNEFKAKRFRNWKGNLMDTKEISTLEHIVPRINRGESSFMNCVLACGRCNNKKLNKEVGEEMFNEKTISNFKYAKEVEVVIKNNQKSPRQMI